MRGRGAESVLSTLFYTGTGQQIVFTIILIMLEILDEIFQLFWNMFDTFFESVEASVKAYFLAGKISRDDLNCIFRKYGIA